MLTLLIEKTKIGVSESEVIILHDLTNKISSYIFTNEYNYKDWVKTQAQAFRKNGYKITNKTDIELC